MRSIMYKTISFLQNHPIYIVEIIVVALTIIYLIALAITNYELRQYAEIANDLERAWKIVSHDGSCPLVLFVLGCLDLMGIAAMSVAEYRIYRTDAKWESESIGLNVLIFTIFLNIALGLVVVLLLNNPIIWAIFVIAIIGGLFVGLSS